MDVHRIIGRDYELFAADVDRYRDDIDAAVRGRRILIYGGAGSIGREVVRQCFSREPAVLHVVDISENNLVELVRDLRSSLGYTKGETQFLPIAMNGPEAQAFIGQQNDYDLVFNLAAMKHVRSEKDPWSLMRMVQTNIIDTIATLAAASQKGAAKYFAVSTDKAKNPANLMGATKRVMEDFLFADGVGLAVSTARFANVAFSDGSLLHGFVQRLARRQPISAPRDVRRYFVTGTESGMLCLAAAALGDHREIFFPALSADADLLTFSEIARRFIEDAGYEPVELDSEAEARARADELTAKGQWPCYFFESDTTGEKPFEEFYSGEDEIDWGRFDTIGVISQPALTSGETRRANEFLENVQHLQARGSWTRRELIELISNACPELSHRDTGTYLDGKM